MKKIFSFALFMLFYSFFAVKAQRLKVALLPEIVFPTGNASNLSSIGFGGAVKAEVAINDRYAITASGGYNTFIGRRYFGSRVANIKGLPVKLGLKHYPSPDFYIEGQAGAVFSAGNATKTSFLWSPGFGTYINTGNKNAKIEFGLRYEAWTSTHSNNISNLKSTSFGFIGLKVGYSFGL